MPKLCELVPEMRDEETAYFRRASNREEVIEVTAAYCFTQAGGLRSTFVIDRRYTMPPDVHIRFRIEANDWERAR